MEHYEFLFKIAEGAYGTVWKCKDKNTGRSVAVKKMKDPTPVDSEEYEFALREVQLLQMLQHDNVVQLLEAYQSTSGRLYLVFEYVEQTLLGLLKASPSGRGLPHPQIKSVMWQLLQSLSFMHNKKVIHRDIKPSNILVSASGTVKLCDFGFARPLEHDQAVADYTTYVVTRWYRAPEVLIGDAYGPAVDIWSFGCIFAELFTGRALFPGRNNNDQLWLVLTGIGRLCEQHMGILRSDSKFASFRLPLAHEYVRLEARLKDVPPEVIQLLKACLHPDPSKRLTADQLLRLPYFYDVESVLPRDYLEVIATREVDRQPALAAEAGPEPAGAAAEPVAAAVPLQQLQQQQQDLQQQQQVLQQQQQQLQLHQQQQQQQEQQQQQLDVATRTKAAIAAATAAVAAAAETAVLNFPSLLPSERSQDLGRKQPLGSVFAGRQDLPQPPAPAPHPTPSQQQLPIPAAARNLPANASPEPPVSMPAIGPSRADQEPSMGSFRRPSSGGVLNPPDSERRRQPGEPGAAASGVPCPVDGQVPKLLTNEELMGKLAASSTLRRSVTAPEEELQLTTAMILGSRGSVLVESARTNGSFHQRISEPMAGGAAAPGGKLAYRASDTNVARPGFGEARQQRHPLQPRASVATVVAAVAAARQQLLQPSSGQPLVPLTGNYTGAEEPAAAAFQLTKGGGGGGGGGQALAMSPSSSSASQLSLDEPLPASATPPLQHATQPLPVAAVSGAQPLRARGGSAVPRSRRSSSDCGMLQQQSSNILSAGLAAAAAALSQQPSVPTTPPKLSALNDGRRQSDSAAGLASSGALHGHQAAPFAAAASTAAAAMAAAATAAAAAAAPVTSAGRRFRKAQSIDGQCLFAGDKGDAARRAWPGSHALSPEAAGAAPAAAVSNGVGAAPHAAAALPPLHTFALMPGSAAALGAAAAPPPLSCPPNAAAVAAPSSLPTPLAPAAEHSLKLAGGRGAGAEHLPVIRGTILGAGPLQGTAAAARSSPAAAAAKSNPVAAARSSPYPQPQAQPPQPQLQQLQQSQVTGSTFMMKPYLPTLQRTSHPQLQSQGAKVDQQARKKQAVLQPGRKV